MRNWTDEQFKAAGWKWVLRFEGGAMACTTSAFDAAQWEKEGLGDVVSLEEAKHNDKP